MPREPRFDVPDDDAKYGGLWRLMVIALVAGILTGLVGGTFRLLLEKAAGLRNTLLDWAGSDPALRWLVPIAVIMICVGLARFIVRFVPEAAGSGVQRLEAEMRGEDEAPRLAILPAKFVGGLLSLGSGMALGREGPTVQMGAAIAGEVGRRTRVMPHDLHTLTASMGGAGLAVAFNAPLGGSMFVFEEVARAFRSRLVLVTLTASFAAVTVAQLVYGRKPDYDVAPLGLFDWRTLLAVTVLGAVCGVLGVLYNRLVVALLRFNERVTSLSPEVKASLVGLIVAVIGLYAPELIGGGDGLTQQALSGTTTISMLVIIVAARWFLGPLCYSVGTPGGLFAPLLVVGAAIGLLVAAVANMIIPNDPFSGIAFALIGMSTFFTAVVRAPVTGIILMTEMTATTSQVLPMMLAAAVATLVCLALRGEPIYDTLRAMTRAADLRRGQAVGA